MHNGVDANCTLVHQNLKKTLKQQFPLTSVRFEIILPKKYMRNGVQVKGYKFENLKEKITA